MDAEALAHVMEDIYLVPHRGDPPRYVELRSLEAARLADLFEPVVVSGDLDIAFVKPHPRPFEAALEALGTSPGETLFVGDRWDMDMPGASALGMRTCHHLGHTSDTNMAGRYERYRPDFTIRRIGEILALVGGDA